VVEAVIFDLDGTLIDSEPIWAAARRETVLEAGGEWSASAATDPIGMSAPEWSRYMRDQLAVPLPAEEIERRVVARVERTLADEVPLMPGALGVLRRLARRWPLGLATSSNRVVIEMVLDHAGLRQWFAATVSSEEVESGKPAPDVYLAVANELNIAPGHAVAIEDSGNGIRSAHAAGMAVIAIPNRAFPPSDDALALAGLVIGSLDDLRAETVQGLPTDSARLTSMAQARLDGGASHAEQAPPPPAHRTA
jgi:HAD superfamily hydrolase (TIGR01509 family)